MAITKQSINMAFETVKDFFKNLINPNMKIEDIADVVSSRLDDVIIEHEKKGLHYSAGKFYIKYIDDKNFQLEFEMFFKDDENKWHKLSNESELREMKLLETGAAATIEKLKVIEFPISAPEISPELKAEIQKSKTAELETEKPVEEKIDEMAGVKPLQIEPPVKLDKTEN